MARHERFSYETISDLNEKIKQLGTDLPLQEDTGILQRPVSIGNKKTPNSIGVLPMEGCDALPEGGPSALLERRYLRFAAGGAGLLWWEACAVQQDGRANPLQMMLTEGNLADYAGLLRRVNAAAAESMGEEHRPLHILQLTHSGRYSRPHGEKPLPIIPQHDPLLDPRVGLSGKEDVVTDTYLDALIGQYVNSARLAREAGFDGVDIKACHRYLISELLASHNRKGRYGGSFENRTRFLLEVVRAVRRELKSGFIIACRFNVFDAHPFPYGFGVDQTEQWNFDESEPVALVKRLCAEGVGLLSNSAGNPYYIHPQVTRPFDLSSQGIPVPREHPLENVARLFRFTQTVQRAAGAVPVVGNGYTWLRQYLPYAGAANLQAGRCSLMGLGRSSFAYPDAPKDILCGVGMAPQKCCTTCSKCTQMMRDHGKTGCVVRDAAVYGPLYKQARREAEEREAVR